MAAPSHSLPKSSVDWTRGADPPTNHCKLIRDYDFASTPLGPIRQWPLALRQSVCQIMAHPQPKALTWGPDHLCLYNEAALPLITKSNTSCLGRPVAEFWLAELEAGLEKQYVEVQQTGKPVITKNMLRPIEGRRRRLSNTHDSPREPANIIPPKSLIEAYFDLTLVPIHDEYGIVAGILHEWTETTKTILADRRLSTIFRVESGISHVQELKGVWNIIISALEPNSEDIPFALAYSTVAGERGDIPLIDRLQFEGAVGIDADHPIVQLTEQNAGLAQFLEEAWSSKTPVLAVYSDIVSQSQSQSPSYFRPDSSSLELSPKSLDPVPGDMDLVVESLDVCKSANRMFQNRRPDNLLRLDSHLRIPGRGLNQDITSVLVVPIPRSTPPDPIGVLVIAMNPMRPFDSEYRGFTALLTESVIKGITSMIYPQQQRNLESILHETIFKHARVTDTLKRRAHASERVEDLLKTLVRNAPFGLAFWTASSPSIFEPSWWNHSFIQMMGIAEGHIPVVDMTSEKDGLFIDKWQIRIHPDDIPTVQENWKALQRSQAADPMQLRVKKAPHEIDHKEGPEGQYRWIRLQSSLHYHNGTDLYSIGGWAVDITNEKKFEAVQGQRLEDALQQKAASEHFIDMMSHELRNPMSAILQSTDTIYSAIRGFKATTDQPGSSAVEEVLHHISGASDVITLCTQHQRRILDDVLTLSKLDASLLVIASEEVDVVSLFNKILQIYEAELRTADIKTSLHVDSSYKEMELDTVLIDPGRFLQVLINLFTNAIKFTRECDQRAIHLHLGASFTRPEKGRNGTPFLPFRDDGLVRNDDIRAEANMRENTQQTVFLEFAIEDTGRGLSPNELKQLFKKFTQASPKTYGKYGGSGLGLYISRDLVELQGGQIGITSQERRGTTLFFYVKVERVLTDNKLARKASLTELLNEFKRRKGPVDRATTEVRLARTTPSPNQEKFQEKKPIFPGTGGRTLSDQYVFESPSEVENGFNWDQQPIYVLLVEDNLINQRILAQQLTKKGLVVSTADNGLEAVHFVRQSDFAKFPAGPARSPMSPSTPGFGSGGFIIPKPLSVVFMDIEMPIMNGLQAASKIRDMEKDGTVGGHVPIVCITANARPENIQRAYDAGMDEVLTKPFRISELLEKMRDCMEKVGGKTSATGGMVMM